MSSGICLPITPARIAPTSLACVHQKGVGYKNDGEEIGRLVPLPFATFRPSILHRESPLLPVLGIPQEAAYLPGS